ncbi:hypothetical protein [Aeoliella sp. SH292]|uniref:hypothetical protein n=1 Tax=Aeoliella sp. SH292 TaxID=3454464 RepID=UPI003F9D5B1E
MKRSLLTIVVTAVTFVLLKAPLLAAEAWITVEVVTEPGSQPTGQREWIEMLTAAGADDVRIRGAHAGDKPELRDSGSPERPRYTLVGMLDGRGQLVLPGGRFDRGSRDKLKDYLDRLGSDGAEGVTAPRGAFGLTEKQTKLMHDDLALVLDTETKGQSLADVLKAADARTKLDLRMDDTAWRVVSKAEPVSDEVGELTVGTALAILLKRDGLVLVPTKERGEEVVHRVALASDIKSEVWPIGWKPNQPPTKLAPKMMERLNAEVEGFSLAEAMDSIAPRAEVPILWDHATLRERKIVPAEIQVKLARQNTSLIRVIDRLLFQARLRGELKMDEAGTVFYWISR